MGLNVYAENSHSDKVRRWAEPLGSRYETEADIWADLGWWCSFEFMKFFYFLFNYVGLTMLHLVWITKRGKTDVVNTIAAQFRGSNGNTFSQKVTVHKLRSLCTKED